MARKSKAAPRPRRVVTLEISAPVTVTFEVEQDQWDPEQWVVVHVRRAECELTPRGAMECMTDSDREELDRRAVAAKNEE